MAQSLDQGAILETEEVFPVDSPEVVEHLGPGAVLLLDLPVRDGRLPVGATRAPHPLSILASPAPAGKQIEREMKGAKVVVAVASVI